MQPDFFVQAGPTFIEVIQAPDGSFRKSLVRVLLHLSVSVEDVCSVGAGGLADCVEVCRCMLKF